jgi:hypothetical protein
MRRPYQSAEPSAVPGSIFDIARPALDVEVTLIASPNGRFDWQRPDSCGEVERIIVDQCTILFRNEVNGHVEHVAHTTFNHRGITVHAVIAAPRSERLDRLIGCRLRELESALEVTLQIQFGWEHAAVTVQIDPNPDYQVRTRNGTQTAVKTGEVINVFQPPGGSNAIAPVIVTVPTHGSGGGGWPPPADLDYYARTRPRERSTALAGLVGGLIVVGFAILIVLAIGPLSDRIDGLYQNWQDSERRRAYEVSLRDQRIASLSQENTRMEQTIRRLTPPRRPPPRRIEQPPPVLSDTDQVMVGAGATGPSVIAASE